MTKNMTLIEFLRFITTCSGDEAIDIISKFQDGSLRIEGWGMKDFG